jgi:hypothetical protein
MKSLEKVIKPVLKTNNPLTGLLKKLVPSLNEMVLTTVMNIKKRNNSIIINTSNDLKL